MKIRVYNDISAIPIDKALWDDLVSKSETNTIFQTYEWFRCWWECFNTDKELLFLVAYIDEKIVGFAPLMFTHEYYCKRVIKFVGDGNSDYNDFIITGNRNETIHAFLNYLYTNTVKWTEIDLNNIPNYSMTRSCIETYHLRQKSHIQILNSTPAPTLLLNEKSDLTKKITSKYSIMRHVRKLNKIGKIEIKHYKDAIEIKKYIETFFEQHIERYNYKKSGSLFENLKNREFYNKLIDCLSNDNTLLFSVLYLDTQPIAFHFGYIYKNTLTWYKPTFNIQYKMYSPGTILLKHLIEYAEKNSLSELDFTIGDEDFKARFSNFKREL